MIEIKNEFIDITNIRRMRYEMDDCGEYLVITYAFDEEHPTRIQVNNHEDYMNVAGRIRDIINIREGY